MLQVLGLELDQKLSEKHPLPGDMIIPINTLRFLFKVFKGVIGVRTNQIDYYITDKGPVT